ncbi:MAG TPA: DUF5367 family protein [Thermoanaerobaculia bacterium]|jgi:hypothetical protein
MKRGLVLGLVLWAVATAVLRFASSGLLPSERPRVILALYGASFLLFFVLIRRVMAPAPGAPNAGEKLRAGVALFLPTLVLDAIAAAFFPTAYPNFAAASAGVFGGWMLICCGGGLAGLISRG